MYTEAQIIKVLNNHKRNYSILNSERIFDIINDLRALESSKSIPNYPWSDKPGARNIGINNSVLDTGDFRDYE